MYNSYNLQSQQRFSSPQPELSQTNFLVIAVSIPQEYFSSFLKDIKSSSLDIGCLFFLSVKMTPHIKSGQWGYQYMNELKQSQSLHHVIQMAVDPHCCTSPQTKNVKFWIHHFLRPVVSDFQTSSDPSFSSVSILCQRFSFYE